MRKFIASLTTVLVMSLGVAAGTAEPAHAAALGYRAQVISGTWKYGPCKALRTSQVGRIAYWDMVADNTDDGHKRTVKAQIKYVRQGCRNGA